MSGVGSTNAMKKGSANNPFLAYSEADMQGFLNSAYTGCIVKYAGEPISRYLTEQNKTVPEYAKNLVFSLTEGGFWDFFSRGNMRIKIQQKTNGSTKTLYITPGRFYNLAWHFNKYDFTNGNLYLTDSLTAPTEIPIAIQEYFSTEPYWRWNKECVNDQGNLIIWTHDQDVTFTIEQATTEYGIVYDSTHGITIVPYKVNELYKVVYGDGKYYYEEFYHISDTRTTANSDYIAPGKTAFDFTGNLQTGNGSKVNPYLAYTVAEFQSFPVGSFIKWLGPGKTVIDATTGQMLIHGEVYRAVEDGDVFQYVILPTLSNPGTATDLAQGKQLIDGEGKVIEGTAGGEIDYTQDVMFWDYDGTLIYACTLEEAKAMTKLPDAPSHADKGLVFFKWNYTLEQVNALTDGADVGALYDTADGKTHLFLDIPINNVTIPLAFDKYNTNDGLSINVDWGDGTIEPFSWDKNIAASTITHDYVNKGKYEIKIENTSYATYSGYSTFKLGAVSYSVSSAKNLFGNTLRSYSPRSIDTYLTKAYLTSHCNINCGNCPNLTEVSLNSCHVAPYGLAYTSIKHVNTISNIMFGAFNYSSVETFSMHGNNLEPSAFLNTIVKRIACIAYTNTYSDSVILQLSSVKRCIWPRVMPSNNQISMFACRKISFGGLTAISSGVSHYFTGTTELYVKTLLPYGSGTKINKAIISAPILEKFILDKSTPTPLNGAFTNISEACKYYVPDDSVDAYKATEGWSEMADRIYPMSALKN